MAEGYVNLFVQDDYAGTNRPHYKGFLKIDGVEHEFALWPAREGKKGFSGKYKPKQAKPVETEATGAIVDKAKELFPGASVKAAQDLGDDIPFLWLLTCMSSSSMIAYQLLQGMNLYG